MKGFSVSKVRYDGLDVLKCLCAFFVVCVHCPVPGFLGLVVEVCSRIAVPIFFMITGFFYEGTVKKGKEFSQIKRIVVLFLGTTLVYGILQLFFLKELDLTLDKYVNKIFGISAFGKLFFFSESSVIFHTLYLAALIGALIFMMFVTRFVKENKRNIVYILCVTLVIFSVILGRYSRVFLGMDFRVYFSRNVYFIAIPYVVLGYLLSKGINTIKEKLNNIYLVIAIVLFSVIGVLEKVILIRTDKLAKDGDNYFSTLFLSVAVFLIFTKMRFSDNSLNNKLKIIKDKVWNLLTQIGRKYSLWIYLVHPACIFILQFLAQVLGVEKSFKWLAPGIVFLFTLAIILMVTSIKNKIFAMIQTNQLKLEFGKLKFRKKVTN